MKEYDDRALEECMESLRKRGPDLSEELSLALDILEMTEHIRIAT